MISCDTVDVSVSPLLVSPFMGERSQFRLRSKPSWSGLNRSGLGESLPRTSSPSNPLEAAITAVICVRKPELNLILVRTVNSQGLASVSHRPGRRSLVPPPGPCLHHCIDARDPEEPMLATEGRANKFTGTLGWEAVFETDLFFHVRCTGTTRGGAYLSLKFSMQKEKPVSDATQGHLRS